MKLRFVLSGLLVAATFIVAGCTASHGAGSRHELYESLDALVADSAIVVLVQLSDSTEHAETDSASGFTAFAASIDEVFQPAGLAGTYEGGEYSQPAPGDEIIVRQLGTSEKPGPSVSLDNRGTYLLFLVPTQVPGADADEFYIVGGTAGAYQAVSGVDGTFQAISDDGDALPRELRVADLT